MSKGIFCIEPCIIAFIRHDSLSSRLTRKSLNMLSHLRPRLAPFPNQQSARFDPTSQSQYQRRRIMPAMNHLTMSYFAQPVTLIYLLRLLLCKSCLVPRAQCWSLAKVPHPCDTTTPNDYSYRLFSCWLSSVPVVQG